MDDSLRYDTNIIDKSIDKMMVSKSIDSEFLTNNSDPKNEESMQQKDSFLTFDRSELNDSFENWEAAAKRILKKS